VNYFFWYKWNKISLQRKENKPTSHKMPLESKTNTKTPRTKPIRHVMSDMTNRWRTWAPGHNATRAARLLTTSKFGMCRYPNELINNSWQLENAFGIGTQGYPNRLSLFCCSKDAKFTPMANKWVEKLLLCLLSLSFLTAQLHPLHALVVEECEPPDWFTF